MPVYSHTFNASAPDASGQRAITEDAWVYGDSYATSEDAPEAPGIHAVDAVTGASKNVVRGADLADGDRITVGGIPMTVGQAKDLGIDIASIGATQAGQPQPVSLTPAQQLEQMMRQDEPTEVTEIDMEDTTTTAGERATYDTMTDSFAFQVGLDAEDVEALGQGIMRGDFAVNDDIWANLQARGVSQASAYAAVEQVHEVSTRAAQRELGHAAFSELETLASRHPAVAELVMMHAIKRMNGTAKASWKDVHEIARRYQG
jgi:hypothetical protein